MPITLLNTSGTGNFTLVNNTNNGKFAMSVAASTSALVTSGLVFNLQTAPSSGTTWTDATGNGYNATLQGSPSYTGSYGGGIVLNNAAYTGTDYISVPYNIGSNTSTIEIVASFNPTSYWGTIWGNENYNSGLGAFAFMTSATTITYGRPGATAAESITASNAVRHWIFVLNNGQCSLYLNGSQTGTTQSRTTGGYASGNFYFGARHPNAGSGAGIDKMNNSTAAYYPVFYQMRFYNKALSGAEITQNYNAIKSTYGI